MTSDGLRDMWHAVLQNVPKALAFVVILVLGWLLARGLRALVARGLAKAGFDRAVERGAAGRTLRAAGISAADLCARIVFWAVVLFALQLAFGLWGPNPVSDLLTALIAWLPRLFVAIVIVVVAAALAGAAHDLIAAALAGLSYGRFLARAAAALIVALGVIAALDEVRIATSVTQPLLIAVLATVAGVVIVGVGGGLVRPMQSRWEGWLDKASTESAAIKEQARTYAEERARLAEQARLAEEARRELEAQEQARRVREAEEQARLAREAEEARLAREAEENARRAEAERRAEQERREQQEQQAEAERRAAEARAEVERRAQEIESSAERTQVIRTGRPHPVPGFGEEPGDAATTGNVLSPREPGATTSEVTAVIGGTGADTTALIPADDPEPTTVIHTAAEDDADRTTVIKNDGEPEAKR
jgi:hypothetical protein